MSWFSFGVRNCSSAFFCFDFAFLWGAELVFRFLLFFCFWVGVRPDKIEA